MAPSGKVVTTSKKTVTKGPVKGRKTGGASKKVDDDNEGPYLILITNGKEQRIKDEEKLKVYYNIHTHSLITHIIHTHSLITPLILSTPTH